MNFGLFNMAVVCKVVVCILKKKNNNNNYINIILVYSYYTFFTVKKMFYMEYKELLNPFHVFRQNILFDLISKLVTISKNFKL